MWKILPFPQPSRFSEQESEHPLLLRVAFKPPACWVSGFCSGGELSLGTKSRGQPFRWEMPGSSSYLRCTRAGDLEAHRPPTSPVAPGKPRQLGSPRWAGCWVTCLEQRMAAGNTLGTLIFRAQASGGARRCAANCMTSSDTWRALPWPQQTGGC